MTSDRVADPASDHPPTEGEARATAALAASGIEHTVTRHGRVGSLEEAAAVRGVEPRDIIKTLVVRRAADDYLFVLVPVPADVAIGRGGVDGSGGPVVERAADAAIDQVAAWAGIPDLRSRIVVRRTFGPGDFAADFNAWCGGALGGPAHTLQQSALFRTGNVSRKVSGLYYAGYGTVPGIGLPMCLISAELVLKRLRGDRSTGPSAEPTPPDPTELSRATASGPE